MLIKMFYKTLSILFISYVLVACGTGETRKLTTDEIVLNPKDRSRLDQVDGGGNFLSDLIGNNSEEEGSFAVSYKSPLWRASLEVLSSFPLANVDAKSGLIITDWYTSEKKPTERFKITVLVLAPEVRADSVKVSVHKQIIKKNTWVNKNIDSKKPLAIERKIIQRAIELNL